jgi:hypothetical protein
MDTPPSNPDSETDQVQALRAEIHTLQLNFTPGKWAAGLGDD